MTVCNEFNDRDQITELIDPLDLMNLPSKNATLSFHERLSSLQNNPLFINFNKRISIKLRFLRLSKVDDFQSYLMISNSYLYQIKKVQKLANF